MPHNQDKCICVGINSKKRQVDSHRLPVINFDKTISEIVFKRHKITRDKSQDINITRRLNTKFDVHRLPLHKFRSNDSVLIREDLSIYPEEKVSKNVLNFNNLRNVFKSNKPKRRLHKSVQVKKRKIKQHNINQNVQTDDNINMLFTSPRFYNPELGRATRKRTYQPVFTKMPPRLIIAKSNESQPNKFIYYKTRKVAGLLPTYTNKKPWKHNSNPNKLHHSYPLKIKPRWRKKKVKLVPHPLHDGNAIGDFPRDKEIIPRKYKVIGQHYPHKQNVLSQVSRRILPNIEINDSACCPIMVSRAVGQSNMTFRCNACEHNSVTSQLYRCLKTSLKCVLYCIMIIVWCPCIAFIFICWLMSSMLRPEEFEREMLDTGKRKYTFCDLLKQSISKACCQTRCALDVVRLPFKCDEKCPPNCQSIYLEKPVRFKTQPNPNKKYVLYHSDNKGWLMKPIPVHKCKKFPLGGGDADVSNPIRGYGNRKFVKFSKTQPDHLSCISKGRPLGTNKYTMKNSRILKRYKLKSRAIQCNSDSARSFLKRVSQQCFCLRASRTSNLCKQSVFGQQHYEENVKLRGDNRNQPKNCSCKGIRILTLFCRETSELCYKKYLKKITQNTEIAKKKSSKKCYLFQFLRTGYSIFKRLCYVFLLILSLIIWSPVILCVYICYLIGRALL